MKIGSRQPAAANASKAKAISFPLCALLLAFSVLVEAQQPTKILRIDSCLEAATPRMLGRKSSHLYINPRAKNDRLCTECSELEASMFAKHNV